MRRLIVGDIHSRYVLMMEALEKAGFNPEEDILYSVGDLCDRGREPVETIRFLMGLGNHFRLVLGNHDAWLEDFLFNGKTDIDWILYNGGGKTAEDIGKLSEEEQLEIRSWLGRFPILRIEDDIIVVHGGFPESYTEKRINSLASIRRPIPLSKLQMPSLRKANPDLELLEGLLWARSYLFSALPTETLEDHGMRKKVLLQPINTEKTIFLGHSPLVYLNDSKPFISEAYHLCALDTGAGTGFGLITVMDMDTKEYWQA